MLVGKNPSGEAALAVTPVCLLPHLHSMLLCITHLWQLAEFQATQSLLLHLLSDLQPLTGWGLKIGS